MERRRTDAADDRPGGFRDPLGVGRGWGASPVHTRRAVLGSARRQAFRSEPSNRRHWRRPGRAGEREWLSRLRRTVGDSEDALVGATCPARSVLSPERSEEHTSELQSRQYLVCRLLLEKKNK